jgi:hypothetical protein
MWIRQQDGTMKLIDISAYPQDKDKINKIIYYLLNKGIYDYNTQTKKTQNHINWMLKEFCLA